MLLTHVGLQQLLLLELQPTAFILALVLLVLLSVDSRHVSGSVCVGGEGLLAAVLGALKGLHPGVCELMSGQMVGAAEGLAAAVLPTCVRLHSGVFTQMRVQFPLLVVSRRAAGNRADVAFLRLRFSRHLIINAIKTPIENTASAR